MLHRPLFVYGTLRDPDLVGAVLGRRPDAGAIAAAVAPGFRVVFHPGRTYPALIPAPGGAAEGEVIAGLSRFENVLLDAFEGTEYRRGIVPVLIEGEVHEADAFLPTLAVDRDAEPWSLARWQREHKAAVLPEDAAVAAHLRQRLSLARPIRRA